MERLSNYKRTMTTETESLQQITSLEDPTQLSRLESIVSSLTPENADESILLALYGIFERFPWQDGHGICWSILHLLESCSNYNSLLVQSVKRQPGEFNLTMVNRLLNEGILLTENENLLDL